MSHSWGYSGAAAVLFLGIVVSRFIAPASSTLPPQVKVGAIFTEDEKNGPNELAFKYAINKINKDKTLLPYTSLVYDIQYVPRDDSFHASKKACQLVQYGVYAIFGPSDPLLGSHIHSVCDALDIPHLEARLDVESDVREFSINLHPTQHLLNAAFQDVMTFLNWTRIAIIYEKEYGLLKLRELVKSPQNNGLEIFLRQSNPDSYQDVLKEVKDKEIRNIVIDTKPGNLQLFLKGILKLQMNDYKYHYLFTTFDMETFDLEDFKYNFVNITAFRIVDTEDISVKEILRSMSKSQFNRDLRLLNSTFIQAEAALIYDSVFVFAIGLQTLEQSHTLKLSNLSCDKEQPWDGGLSLINYINSVELKGLSGPIEFKEGRRIKFKLDLLKLKQPALVKVGEWQPVTGVNITDRAAFFDSGTMNFTLVVTTILETPYVMMHTTNNYTGNNRFYGFCIDILDRISQEVGFDYLLDLVPDRKYGARDPSTGLWNGMVLQLMQHDSMIETYKKMWRFMENRKPSVFVPTYEEGIQKVLDGNYAFLMESTMLDYIVQRNCNLTQIGAPLDSKGYGIATPKGSPWRDRISLAILELQEKGEIQMLYDKWWKKNGDICHRNVKGKESKASSLGVDNIGGVFVVLLCGLTFAVIIAIFEFCYNSKKNASNDKRSASVPHQSLCSEMKGEFCFALKCGGSRQRPALRRKCSKCMSDVSYVPATLDVPPHPPLPPVRSIPRNTTENPSKIF
ncbi:glutamate receptor ionotropic, kainate 2-like isoform X4 [Diorhabda sublineata]|uniref:glutamate receptor ionotropic, kainate 2-like isoform X4 n=1 Tax=Diorhabda sublineata TaxID=1163346 RepID=UPI0024E0533B|nr:glutamate receptor ionotropic, kainate 2-like isoform X4 [Diorhabda sublineata]